MLYIENNLSFRTVASLALERFKNNQSFVMKELMHNSADYTFSKASIESLLLMYDIYFKYILFMEGFFLRVDVITDMVEKTLCYEHSRVYEQIRRVMSTNLGIYSQEFVKIFMSVEDEIFFIIQERITKSCQEDKDRVAVFSGVSYLIISVLNSSLTYVHEIDNIIKGNVPFICVGDIECSYKITEHFFVERRLLLYREFLNIGNDIIIKDYSNDEACLSVCKEQLEKSGYHVVSVI